MKKLFFIISIFLMILWGVPSFAVDLSTYNYLKDLDTFSSENKIEIVLYFKKPIKAIREPQFFEKSIQFVFDKTYVVPAKKTFNLGEDLISGLHVYQYDKKSVRLRLFIGKQDIQFEDRLTYEKKGNDLVISISKEGQGIENSDLKNEPSIIQNDAEDLPLILQSPPSEKQDLNKSPFVKNVDLINSTPLVSTMDNLNNADESKTGLSLDNKVNDITNLTIPTLFSSSIRIVAALFIVLASILITYYFVKRFVLKDGLLLGKDRMVRVISTNYIAPKKSINFVEVAGEVLVLGVTATNISLLTRIENKEIAERIKRKKEGPLSKPSIFSFPSRIKVSNRKENKQTSSAFSKQLDRITSKAEKTGESDKSITVLNQMIQEKIKNLQTV